MWHSILTILGKMLFFLSPKGNSGWLDCDVRYLYDYQAKMGPRRFKLCCELEIIY